MKKIKTINLFVACSPTSEFLNEKKEKLMELCRELNVEFADKGFSFIVSPVSYEDPERRKLVFDKYIESRADIVIFLVDNKRDDVLVNELKLAVERNNTFNKPEVLVFASNIIEENQAFNQEIKQICAEGGWLYEPLKNTEDLKDNVKEKIYRYVRSYKSIRELRIMSKWRYYGWRILVILLVLSFFIGHYFYSSWKTAESKKLLIFGGGSARSFIEKECLKSTNDTTTVELVRLKPKSWWYAPMPSGDAYRMITEEIINIEGDYKSRPYYSIVLSAERAYGDTLFKRGVDVTYFRKKGYVIGIHIGNDYLVAYGSQHAFDGYNKNTNSIKEDLLDTIINDQALKLMNGNPSATKIYTTNKNSGTLNTYLDTTNRNKHNGLNKYLETCEKKGLKLIFSSTDPLENTKDGNEWIALGSKYYYPKNEHMDSLIVFKKDNERIEKPIYVYFLLYMDTDSIYKLPNATKEFLNAIHVNDSVIDTIERINEFNLFNSNTILYDKFESLK